MNTFYSTEELSDLGLKKYGKDVLISRKCSIYNPENLSLGNNVRIDDFCLLSGNISIGSNVHISAYCGLYGSFGIQMEDFTGLSPRCLVFSASDDFSGEFLISPMVAKEKTNVTGGKVIIKKYSQIGANSVIMPNIVVGEGVAVGAMSFVNNALDEWSIYAGIPAKKIKVRSKGLLTIV